MSSPNEQRTIRWTDRPESSLPVVALPHMVFVFTSSSCESNFCALDTRAKTPVCHGVHACASLIGNQGSVDAVFVKGCLEPTSFFPGSQVRIDLVNGIAWEQ